MSSGAEVPSSSSSESLSSLPSLGQLIQFMDGHPSFHQLPQQFRIHRNISMMQTQASLKLHCLLVMAPILNSEKQ